MKKWTKESFQQVLDMYEDHTYTEIAKVLKAKFGLKKTPNAIRKAYKRYSDQPELLEEKAAPKILFFDIETLPIEAYVWGIWNVNIPLSMIKTDWTVLSYAAKWLHSDEIFYEDIRNQKNLRDDSKILKGIWKLIDEADIIVGHNSKSFDTKKLNARFSLNGMQPPSSVRQMDTKNMAKRAFSHTSNKLAYLTEKYCKKYVKLSHGKFPGFKLWGECLKKNMEAFDEMEEYNKYDVLSLEELFVTIAPWDSTFGFEVYSNEEENRCNCGSRSFKKSGFHYTNTAKYQKHKCKECGAEYRDRKNLIGKDKKKSLRVKASK